MNIRIGSIIFIISVIILLAGCRENDPKKEDVPELITKVVLTFSPTTGGSPIIVSATDPDGEGIQNIQMDGPINLPLNKTYTMQIDLINGLADANSNDYHVTTEVAAKGEEHQFFFAWTSNAFSDPSGNGNIDNAKDPVNYAGGDNSKDANGRPLGITTTWTTAANATSGSTFRILLKHQPGLKSDTSNSTQGETDLDVSFTLNVQ
ncbi:MAG TPA: hypothetical protein VF473_08715 [Cyclobacteriaceae bacterium]